LEEEKQAGQLIGETPTHYFLIFYFFLGMKMVKCDKKCNTQMAREKASLENGCQVAV
jgi:hypothetical protein